MSKRMFSVIRMSRVIVPFLLASGMCACVDDEYDLDKDISLEVGIGGKYFAIPLGSTDSIRVDSLLELDDESVFMFMEDGTATITKSDEVDVRVPEIRQVTISGWESEIEPIDKVVDLSRFASEDIGDWGTSIESDPVDINSQTEIKFEAEVPEELERLDEVKFVGEPMLDIYVRFTAPDEVQQVRLVNYTIVFPDFIDFVDGQDVEDHRLVINEPVTIADGYEKHLKIEGFHFEENPIDDYHQLLLEGALTLDGQLAVIIEPQGTVPSEVEVQVMPSVSVGDLEVGEIVGKVNVDIDPVNEVVDLGDIPDFLKDKDVVLDITHPMITLEVGNTTGVPVVADLELLPMVGDNVIENGKIVLNGGEIAVKAADVMGDYTWTNFFISNSNEGMEPGYEYVGVSNLPNLIRQIPDEIQIKMTAVADESQEHRFDLSHGDYEMKVKYNVNVPLQFGEDLLVVYRDTVNDFNKDIADYVKYVEAVEMELQVENMIPLGMNCSIVALDVEGRALPDIEVSSDMPIEPADWENGKPVMKTSEFTITLTEKVEGEMEKLDGLGMEIKAHASEGVHGAVLKKDQYLRLSGKMRIPGGISVDIDDI